MKTPPHFWLGLLALLHCSRPQTTEHLAQPSSTLAPLRLRGVPVERRRLEPQMTLVGRLAPYERAEMSARAAGIVIELRVELGDRVRAGQVLAVLQVPGLRAQVEAAAAETDAARQEVAVRDDTTARAQAVKQRNPAAIADQELRTAEGSLASARARASAKAADARRLSDLFADTRLVAPFDGAVVARYKDRGASVRAGDVLLEVARLDPLRLRLEVPEALAGLIQVGAPVRVVLPALGGRRVEAAISRFARALDPRTRMLPTEIDLKNADGALVAGVHAEVRLLRGPQEAALVVPAEAVLTEAGEPVVYVADGGVARRRQVRRGYDSGLLTEIDEGLQAGEVVLLGGRGLLRDGVSVEVARCSARGGHGCNSRSWSCWRVSWRQAAGVAVRRRRS
jgi:RND family efflux transporter MFP subunit